MIKYLSRVGILSALGASVLVTTINVAPAHAEMFIINAQDPSDTIDVYNSSNLPRPDEGEHTNEQNSIACDTAGNCVMIGMRSGGLELSAGSFDANGVYTTGPAGFGPQPNDNIQGACMPFKLQQGAGGKVIATRAAADGVAPPRWLSNNDGQNYRNYHHTNMQTLDATAGNLRALVSWNYQENGGNSERYIQVVDQNCQTVTLGGNLPTLNTSENSRRIMAKNNDDCSGRQSGGGSDIFVHPDGKIDYVSYELCNGNGRDDGWYNHITLTPSGNGYTVVKDGDESINSQEERGRGKCSLVDLEANDGIPDHAVCTYTKGNNQPQRQGVWVALVNLESDDEVWNEELADDKRFYNGQLKTDAMRIKHTMLENGDAFVTFNYHWGYNQQNNGGQNRKGGFAVQEVAAILELTTNPNVGFNVKKMADVTGPMTAAAIDGAHLVQTDCTFGQGADTMEGACFLSGSFNDSTRGAELFNVAYDAAANDFVWLGSESIQAPLADQLYSNLAGNNPNNQGRNYADCIETPNPFMNNAGPTQGIAKLNLCGLAGKATTGYNPGGQYKPDFVLEIFTTMTAEPQGGANPPAPPSGEVLPETDPKDNKNPGGQPGNATPVNSGCSSTTGFGFALLLLTLGLGATRRRQAN